MAVRRTASRANEGRGAGAAVVTGVLSATGARDQG
jgi:hypothetical protein